MSLRVRWNGRPWISRRRALFTTALELGLLALACESPFKPGDVAAVDVAVATSGTDLDTNGYAIVLDSQTPRPVSMNGTLHLTDVPAGPHQLSVVDVEGNCTVPDNPRTIRVPDNGVLDVSILVTCRLKTGNLSVWVHTTGSNVDTSGYSLFLDGQPVMHVPSDGGVNVNDIPVGRHALTFSNVASNCALTPSPVEVDVSFGVTSQVDLTVTCLAPGPAVRLGFTVQPSRSTAGAAISPAVQVAARDTGGFVATGFTGTVTLAIGANPGGGALTGTTSVQAVAGVATFTDLHISQTGTGYTLVAASSTLAPDTSAAFNVVADTTPSLHITTTTTGTDIPTGYFLCVDLYSGYSSYGCNNWVTISANGAVTLPVSAGSHTVGLDNVPLNCTVTDNPRTISVTSGTTEVPFAISCVALGTVHIATATSGVDLDPNGYTACVTGFDCIHLGVNDTGSIAVPAGARTVALSDVEDNCTVSGSNPQPVIVVGGGTVDVTLQITCVAAHRDIAFNDENRNGISVMSVTGSTLLHLVSSGSNPSWSPDGSKIAFIANTCGPAGCHTDIYTMHPDGTAISPLFTGGAGTVPDWVAWKPDGTSLAFSGQYNGTYGLYLVTADGSTVTPVITGVGGFHPSWSPDGTRLAFSCQVQAGNADICVVNADGSGLARLTTDSGFEQNPAWKPDGSTILFQRSDSTYNGLATINPDGSGEAGVVPVPGAFNAAWSPDGLRIVFTAPGTCWSYSYSYCSTNQIDVVNADGTNLTSINGAGNSPAWRP